MALRWGIVGVGSISMDFCVALEYNLTVGQHKIVAVASRDVNRSKNFAKSYNIPKYYGSYKELAQDDEVDVAYIAVLNPFQYEVCQLMLNNKKHILCEKPFCVNYWQVKSTLDLAKSQNLFAMGGFWSRFFPAYAYLKEMINSKVLEDIKEVYVKHGYKADIGSRVVKKELGGGIVLDIGVLAIQFVLFCFNEPPISTKATGKINSEGIDMHFEAEMHFSGGRFAKIVCSGLNVENNQAVIISKRGTACLPIYWCPTSIIEPNCAIRTWWIPDTGAQLQFTNSLGLRYEADEVRKCIHSRKLSSDLLSTDDMLLIAKISDEIRKQIGVRYDCDNKKM